MPKGSLSCLLLQRLKRLPQQGAVALLAFFHHLPQPLHLIPRRFEGGNKTLRAWARLVNQYEALTSNA